MKSLLLAAGAAALLVGAAHATPVTLTGNYLQVGISDVGTFGSNDSTEPGILHDPTGAGNFCPDGVCNDYLTPGSPHDGFAINSDQTGFLINDNNDVSGAQLGTGSPTNTSSGGVQSATWTGSSVSGVMITNTYSFGANDEQILITTTITNNTGADLTNLYFGRSEDPDPDVNRFGSFDSINTRGDSTHAATDLVSAAGPSTGLTIGILNTSTLFKSNTDISGNCCNNNDPNLVFNGTDPDAQPGVDYPNTITCDCGLQMAWDIGTLANGSSAMITYEYVFGTNQGTVGGGGVPEPATWALLLIGFGGLGAALRRRPDLARA